jgi:hypothetical protein
MSILKTKVIYRDVNTSEMLNKDIIGSDEIHVDLDDVGAISESDNDQECIIFIHGRDLVIKTPYVEALALWAKSKQEEHGG